MRFMKHGSLHQDFDVADRVQLSVAKVQKNLYSQYQMSPTDVEFVPGVVQSKGGRPGEGTGDKTNGQVWLRYSQNGLTHPEPCDPQSDLVPNKQMAVHVYASICVKSNGCKTHQFVRYVVRYSLVHVT